ncbi:MAG: hypothetical protein F6K65_26835 [Moorea sp. SIO3C2]|nr:hypothetical protein [Moorena sp. SIO3C2]
MFVSYQLSAKGLWPRYANSHQLSAYALRARYLRCYQLKAFGHATRTAIRD